MKIGDMVSIEYIKNTFARGRILNIDKDEYLVEMALKSRNKKLYKEKVIVKKTQLKKLI